MTLKGTRSDTEETRVDNWSIANNAVVKSPATQSFHGVTGFPPVPLPSFRMEIKGYRRNELPTSEDGTVSANEDEAFVFAVDNFSFSDDDSGDSLQYVKIVTLPANGTLVLDGTASASGDLPTRAAPGEIAFELGAEARRLDRLDGGDSPDREIWVGIGWRLDGAGTFGFETGIEALRREPANDNPDHGLALRVTARW